MFTSEKLDKLDELVDTLKDFKINDAECFLFNSVIVNEAKGDPASDPKIVTHNSDGKGKVTYTSNRIL